MGATCLNLNGQSRGIQQELQQESQQESVDSNSGGLSGRDVSPNPNSKFDLTIGVKGVGLDSSALDGVNALQPTLDLSGLTVNFIPDQFNVKRDSKRKRRMLQKRTALRKP